jgi:ATP-binding cassette subfamily B protein
MATLPSNPIKLVWFSLKKQRRNVIAMVLLSIVLGLIPSIGSIFLKNIIDNVEKFSSTDPLGLLGSMAWWVVGYALWWELINWTWRSYDYLYLKTMPKIKAQVLDEFYNYVQYHSHLFFQNNLTGHITNRITEASRSFGAFMSITNEKLILKASIITAALITMYSVHPIFALIFAIWVLVFCSISFFFSKTISQYSNIYSSDKANVAGTIVDTIVNIASIRMFVAQRFERKHLRDSLDISVQSEQNMQWFLFKLRYALGFSCSVMILFMLYYLCDLRSQLKITVGDFALVLTLCVSVADNIWDLTREIGSVFEEFGVLHQSLSLIEPYTIVDTKDAKDIEVTEGKIEFRNVTFRYRKNSNIFADKSVIIKGGQKVGLVGFSGSGKTTFVNLITRLFDVYDGTIEIDGEDIDNVTQESLRRNISVIPQEPVLFHRTVMENIKYAKQDATDEEVYEAARQAHIHDDILELPEGYDTMCGERGSAISGGQRQRIEIARAILKDTPILILDEATSALDSMTESLIQDSLKTLMEGKTVLVIAHRLSTLLNMDRILVFSNGTIVQDGSHDELLKSNNLYNKLWHSQVRGFIAETPV